MVRIAYTCCATFRLNDSKATPATESFGIPLTGRSHFRRQKGGALAKGEKSEKKEDIVTEYMKLVHIGAYHRIGAVHTFLLHIFLLILPAVSDEEDHHDQGITFNHECEQVVIHAPEDRLDGSGVKMKPDRVIGLHLSEECKEYLRTCPFDLESFPIKDCSIAYPFLVVEAKKESDAPGFHAAECQSAFPIRRFLKLQEKLQSSLDPDLDPLVWYFAFQGDIWRVYAAVLHRGKYVRDPKNSYGEGQC